jgi:hypothetical protein
MRRLLTILLSTFAAWSRASEDAKLLEAVALVETGNDPYAVGDRGRSLGKYQMGERAWAEANDWLRHNNKPTIPRSEWGNPKAQDKIASAFLRVCRDRFARYGVPSPTPAQLATVWNLGFQGARNRGFRPNDYGLRVSNLYFARRR